MREHYGILVWPRVTDVTGSSKRHAHWQSWTACRLWFWPKSCIQCIRVGYSSVFHIVISLTPVWLFFVPRWLRVFPIPPVWVFVSTVCSVLHVVRCQSMDSWICSCTMAWGTMYFLVLATAHRILSNSSGVRLTSRSIFLNNPFPTFSPLWIGIVVFLPSECARRRWLVHGL